MLFAFTWMESVVVAETCVEFKPSDVLAAMAALVLVFVCLYYSALKVKNNPRLTMGLVAGLLISILLQCIFSLVSLILGYSHWAVQAWSILGVAVTGMYIIADLEMLFDENRIQMDDYILGALTLYVDLVRMFIYILGLIGKRKR